MEANKNNIKLGGNNQKLMLFNLGNAISGPPTNKGNKKLPKPPIIAGITIKKIINMACALLCLLSIESAFLPNSKAKPKVNTKKNKSIIIKPNIPVKTEIVLLNALFIVILLGLNSTLRPLDVLSFAVNEAGFIPKTEPITRENKLLNNNIFFQEKFNALVNKLFKAKKLAKSYLLLEEACSLEPSTSEMLLVVPAVIKIFIKNKNNLFTGAAVGLATKIKKAILLKGLNCKPLLLPKSVKGITNNINIAANIDITPNNLLGIDLKIA
ncbi:hypothetical protein MJO29_016702 [Puccinia striiformis f. sp. tritici]|nr:hypothetical protein MJO29_016702 [Puccinia striiformis f. sp. tritici]